MDGKMKTLRKQVLQHDTELLGGCAGGDSGGYVVPVLTSSLNHPIRGYQFVEEQIPGSLDQHGECGICANQQARVGSAWPAMAKRLEGNPHSLGRTV
jgi:hypothetical protein